MLIPKLPVSRILGQLDDDLPGLKATKGGVQGQRNKGLSGKADRLSIGQAGYDDNACGKVPHGLSKGCLIKHCGLFAHWVS